VLVGVLLAAGLSGCSGGTSSYCSALKDDRTQLTRLAVESAKPGAKGADALARTLVLLDGLRDKAPDDIADEWNTLVDALQGVADAIKESGAAPGDFAGGTRPQDVTSGQYQAVQQAVAELQTTRVRQAGASIEQHAQDVCKVDLGSGLGGVG
jgi:hypothetical protein